MKIITIDKNYEEVYSSFNFTKNELVKDDYFYTEPSLIRTKSGKKNDFKSNYHYEDLSPNDLNKILLVPLNTTIIYPTFSNIQNKNLNNIFLVNLFTLNQSPKFSNDLSRNNLYFNITIFINFRVNDQNKIIKKNLNILITEHTFYLNLDKVFEEAEVIELKIFYKEKYVYFNKDYLASFLNTLDLNFTFPKNGNIQQDNLLELRDTINLENINLFNNLNDITKDSSSIKQITIFSFLNNKETDLNNIGSFLNNIIKFQMNEFPEVGNDINKFTFNTVKNAKILSTGNQQMILKFKNNVVLNNMESKYFILQFSLNSRTLEFSPLFEKDYNGLYSASEMGNYKKNGSNIIKDVVVSERYFKKIPTTSIKYFKKSISIIQENIINKFINYQIKKINKLTISNDELLFLINNTSSKEINISSTVNIGTSSTGTNTIYISN